MALMLQGHHLLLRSSSLTFPFQCFACSSAAVLSFCSAGKIEQKGGRFFFSFHYPFRCIHWPEFCSSWYLTLPHFQDAVFFLDLYFPFILTFLIFISWSGYWFCCIWNLPSCFLRFGGLFTDCNSNLNVKNFRVCSLPSSQRPSSANFQFVEIFPFAVQNPSYKPISVYLSS